MPTIPPSVKKYLPMMVRFQTQLVFGVVFISVALLHGFNMFHYPYFESDEGTYMAQAFSVKEHAELTPYVYWYDHPPMGWFVLASFVTLLGGDWDAFGNSLYTGRVLMWLLHLLQVSIIFYLVRKLTGSPWYAVVAILLYSVSPLASYFQRRILLDNIQTTFVLLSVFMLYLPQIKLRHVLMSGVFYGCAVVTKITAVMFGPAFLLLLLTAKWGLHKGFRTIGWLVTSGAIVSLWLIFALIKTELFPAADRVSLLGSLQYQASRGTGAHFWEATSSFRDNIVHWLILDSTYVYICAFGLLAAFLLVILKPQYRFFGLAALFYFLFLIRGGVVIGFYIIPLLPFIAMSIAFLIHTIKTDVLDRFRVPAHVSTLLLLVILVGFTIHYTPKVHKYLTVDETSNQIKALTWVKENLPSDAKIITDIYGLTELRNPEYVNTKVFDNADWYFKVAMDPAIRYTKYRDDWRNFDYVLITHEMLFQADLNKMPVVHDAIRNSVPVIKWDENSTSFTDIQNFITTNGDWVALHRINNNTRTQLLYAWNHYKSNFIVSYGQVIDPQTNITTSEGQSYAMLKAVQMNDRDTFNGVWLWTQHHLQHRVGDDLVSWRWEDGRQTDSANATDADIDIALALIFASQQFDNPQYLAEAREILKAIWEQTVVEINGTYYLLPVEKTLAARPGGYLLNPSYFSPAHYRIFAEVDTERSAEWNALAVDTYETLNRLQARGGVGLPPNWVLINDTTGALSSASPYIAAGGADYFGYDAFRTLWRVGLDEAWFETPESIAYLTAVTPQFEREWSERRSFGDLYLTSGQRISNNQNLAVASGILAGINVAGDAQVSADIYNTLFVDELYVSEEDEEAYWGEPGNYYSANWTWFGMALFNDNFPNLWQFHQSNR
jgi:endo-1,4-beta-D-glucanase Y/4-amino-4-deoxy-L-arabinose transferase-like glycosyltransferase